MRKQTIAIVMALFFLMVIPMAFASEGLPAQKQYGTVILWQACDNSTYSNISSVKSGSTAWISSKPMTQSYDDYYEYTFTNTSDLGTYVVNGICNEDGAMTSWAYDFVITGDGQGFTYGTIFFITLLCIAVVILILSFIFSNYIFSFFSGLTFCLTGVYSMIYGFTSILSNYTRMASMIILGMGLIVTVVSSLELIKEASGEDDTESYSEDYD